MAVEPRSDQQDKIATGQTNTATGSEERVGRGKPPLHSRFKPGVSGNPSGRRRGTHNQKVILERVLNEMIAVRQGKKTLKISTYEAMVRAQVMKAIKGDTRAANAIHALAIDAGLLAGVDDADQTLSKDDVAIIDDYIRRRVVTRDAETKPGIAE